MAGIAICFPDDHLSQSIGCGSAGEERRSGLELSENSAERLLEEVIRHRLGEIEGDTALRTAGW